MRISHVVSHVDEEASGPSYSVPRLCEALAQRNVKITLATLNSRNQRPNFDTIEHFEFCSAPYIKKLGISKTMKRWFESNASEYDIIHAHGLWMMPNIYPINAAYDRGVPSVISPRGTLSKEALAFSSSIKSLFWMLKQKSAMNKVAGFHATSEAECEDIRRLGFKQPVAIIPNGIDLCEAEASIPNKTKTVISLGRLHPKKGLELAIKAWSRLQSDFIEWNLRIIGTGSKSYIDALNKLVQQSNAQRVMIEGPLYGGPKIKALQSASIFILPTRNENFGMVIAEALAAGTPVITTHGAPWEKVTTNKCGWWVDVSDTALEEALREAMSLPEVDLNEMGRAGQSWMEKDFQWASIAQRMIHFYQWIRLGGEKQDFIVTD